ncbi:MAG: hypothetical protein H7247_05705 [Polaromonas sp.]|nr:hypothetical protein [Gemmatimonadaceae bacterium]
MSPFDYTRENIALLREDVKQQFNHERAYRKQYGDMAANAMVALSEQGWVTLKLSQLQQGQETMQKGQNRIFVTAFGLLVSTLSLSIAVIFNVATR